MNKKIQVVLIILSFFMIDIMYAQTEKAKVDSLENLLKTNKTDDTVKVNLLNEIAFSVYTYNNNQTRSYAIKACELAEKLGFMKGMAESIRLIGISYSISDKSKAFECYQKALQISEKINYNTGIVKCLTSIGAYHSANGYIAKAIECYQKGIKIAEKLDDKLELANCWLYLSDIYKNEDNYDKATEGYQLALKIFENKNDKKNAAKCINSIGVIHTIKGNHPLALELFQKCLKYGEEQNDTMSIYGGISNMGNVYLLLCDFPKALEHYQKALKIAEKINKKRFIAACYGNIGTTYQRMNSNKALEYFSKSLAISEVIDDKMITVSVLIYIGDYYLPKGELYKALESYLKAMKISDENGMERTGCAAMNNVGTIYYRQKNYSLALNYCLKGLEIANKLKSVNTQKDIHFQLSEIFAATNDYKKAYLNYKLYKELSDSLFGQETLRKITGLEYNYKYEKEKQAYILEQQKKEAIQTAEKKQQQTIIIALIVSIILLSSIAVIVFRSNRLKHNTNIILTKQKEEILEKNEELLQMNDEISVQKEEIILINAEIEIKNSKLQELNDTKDKFFGIIAHDLKNPFNAILNFSSLLVAPDYQYNKDENKEIIGMMHSSAKNAYKLLENLLEWSRAQTGGIEFNPVNLVLKDLVTENVVLCENISKEKNISISHEIPNNLVVNADRNMLSTVLRNLITNAIKFTHKGGDILISSILQHGEITITVRDSGIGMDEKTKSKLFKINEKISILGTEQERGTGLGLLLCKEFVEKHGGKIWAESELGKGSEFKLTIPV